MIARVVERVSRAHLVDEVWVATDDERVAAVAEAAGARVAMTSRAHRSGTDRVAEAARVTGGDVVLNLQGDEPLLDPTDVDRLAAALLEDEKLAAVTLAYPISSPQDWQSPDVVKVVTDEDGAALYFSRSPLPYDRDREGALPEGALKHLGLYGFRREVLLEFASSAPSRLERLEQLEQLRLLERGVRLKVVRAASDSIAVDRPADLERVERRLAELEADDRGGAGGGAIR